MWQVNVFAEVYQTNNDFDVPLAWLGFIVSHNLWLQQRHQTTELMYTKLPVGLAFLLEVQVRTESWEIMALSATAGKLYVMLRVWRVPFSLSLKRRRLSLTMTWGAMSGNRELITASAAQINELVAICLLTFITITAILSRINSTNWVYFKAKHRLTEK